MAMVSNIMRKYSTERWTNVLETSKSESCFLGRWNHRTCIDRNALLEMNSLYDRQPVQSRSNGGCDRVEFSFPSNDPCSKVLYQPKLSTTYYTDTLQNVITVVQSAADNCINE